MSITRRMYRSGESEYEINGDSCRLLDIQELLSDSGIGREMHVIVGQGQLDAVLHAKPEDRRAFIEEAAGVLKHRKRKEKALRKLDAMQTNLNRLTDLTTELRRQLKPLGRQAEVARRAAGIQADLRDARLRLLADDLATLRDTLTKEIADETALRTRREQVEADLAEVQARLASLEAAHAADQPVLTRAQQTWYELSSLQERFRSTEQLATERLRHLSAATEDERPGRDPEEIAAEAETDPRAGGGAARRARRRRGSASRSGDPPPGAGAHLAEAERALVTAVKAIADRREGLAKLTGQVDAARTRAHRRRGGDRAARHRVRGGAGARRGGRGAVRDRAGRDRRPRARRLRPGAAPARRGRRGRRPPALASRSWPTPSGPPSGRRRVARPRGGPRPRPAPQGRRRRAARRRRFGTRAARQRRGAARGRPRPRGRAGGRARRSGRRGRGVAA